MKPGYQYKLHFIHSRNGYYTSVTNHQYVQKGNNVYTYLNNINTKYIEIRRH